MFGAILFITSVFVIYTSRSGLVLKEIGAFENYRDNYLYEGLNVLNNAIYEKSNLSDAMRNYTFSFLEFAQSNNGNIGLVFLFSRENRIYVNNFINEPIIVQEINTINYLEEKVIDYEDTISLNYHNETYSYIFTMPEKTELKVLLVETNKN